MSTSRLFLIPNFLGEDQKIEDLFPSKMKEVVKSLEGVIVEDEKCARALLLRFLNREEYQNLQICKLSEHTSPKEKQELADLIFRSNKKWGLLSDAGLPCIADPGSDLVLLLKEKNIPIEALVGPSSIFLALMLSGLPGQCFSFQGYLPQDEKKEQEILKQMEKSSLQEKKTYIWMDTPYRTDKQLDFALQVLSDETYLSLAVNILLSGETVITKRVKEWKKERSLSKNRPFGKVRALFLLFCDRR